MLIFRVFCLSGGIKKIVNIWNKSHEVVFFSKGELIRQLIQNILVKHLFHEQQ